MRAAARLSLLAATISAAACSPTYTYRSEAAQHPGDPPALGGRLARALHFGDFGDGTEQQDAVAAAMVGVHRTDPFDLAISAGDNVYDCGPNPTLPGAEACQFDDTANAVVPGYVPPDDPLFRSGFEAPLAPFAEDPAVPIWLALGNHDVAKCDAKGLPEVVVRRRRACLEVAHRTPLWTMPGRHYVVDHGPARFIVFDSNLVNLGAYGGFTLADEVAFVAAAAEGCADRICFLVGHHPPVTAGSHADDATPSYHGRMQRILDAGGDRIRAYLAAHDHDLQHLRMPAGLDVFVSGNGSRGRAYERFEEASLPDADLLFASVRWGFGVVEVLDEGWTYRFVTSGGAATYCCAARGAGRCEPVRCG